MRKRRERKEHTQKRNLFRVFLERISVVNLGDWFQVQIDKFKASSCYFVIFEAQAELVFGQATLAVSQSTNANFLIIHGQNR